MPRNPNLLSSHEYQPQTIVLERYAEIILASVRGIDHEGTVTEGLRPGDRVLLYLPEEASSLAHILMTKIIEAGAVPVLLPDSVVTTAALAEIVGVDGIEALALPIVQALAQSVNHFIDIAVIRHDHPDQKHADVIHRIGVKMRKVMLGATTDPTSPLTSRVKIYWPTQALADQNGVTLEQLWQNLIAGLCLDESDYMEKLVESDSQVKQNAEKLNALKITQLHIESENGDTNLTFSLAKDSCWVGASGANRPSYECFTAVHRDSANGYITYNVPVKFSGHTFSQLKVHYQEGRAVKVEGPDGSDHHQDSKVFRQLFEQYPNFDRLGEFALTPSNLSKLTQGFGVIMWTENLPGLHFAHGSAYPKNYKGEQQPSSDTDWEVLGFNRCSAHFDLVKMGNFTVTATLADGSTTQIYKNGVFTFNDLT